MKWSWLKQFLFGSTEEEACDLDEENRIIKEIEDQDLGQEKKVIKDIGVVTFIQNGVVEINKTWIAYEDTFSLQVGTLVAYSKTGNAESNVVTDLELIENVSHQTKFEDTADYEGVICFVDDEKILLDPGSLLIWRNDTEITFHPEVGDCIKLENCDRVLRIFPIECRIVTDVVKYWNGKFGLLKGDIKISLDVCEHFYVPKEGDSVVASIISCRGKDYQWRSLIVAKLDAVKRAQKKIDIRNIPVFIVPAEKNKVIDVPVKNISFKPLEIDKVQINPTLANVTLIYNPVKQVQPGVAVTYKIMCNGTQLGWTSFELYLKFKTFTYKKKIKFLTEEENSEQIFGQNDEFPNKSLNFIDQHRRLNFLKVRPKNYYVPSYLLEIPDFKGGNILDYMTLLQNKVPELCQGLTTETYSNFFHVLLFLEELAEMKSMCDLETVAPLIKKGQYYVYVFEKETNYSSLFVGDIVQLSNPWIDDGIDSAVDIKICLKTENEIYLHFKDVLNIIGNRPTLFRMKFKRNRSTTIRTHHAIDYFLKHIDVKWLYPNAMNFTPKDYYHNNTRQSYKKNYFKDLNDEQIDTINNIVFATDNYNYPYLIFGPPGTGKTYTLVETTLQTIRHFPECKILIAAPSNSAVDTFCNLLIASGILDDKELIRLTSFSYVQQGQLPVNLVQYSAISSCNIVSDCEIRSIDASDLIKYKVIAGTLSTLSIINCFGLKQGFFTHIYIDEAGQTTEPESLIALATMKPGYTRVVLAGDPNQLGPVILSPIAKEYHLGESLMMRLMSLPIYSRILKSKDCSFKPKIMTTLRRNYRSLPPLVKLTSSIFYNDELIPLISDINSREANVLNEIKKTNFGSEGLNIILINVNGKEEGVKGEGYSFCNPMEASRVTITVLDLYKVGIKPQQIGIITPYSLQVKQIRQCFNFLKTEPPKIGTVEEFQGAERDVIIISSVRTILDECRLSFISDPRRANVTLSRAKVMNVIIGKESTLRMSGIWKQVLNKI